MATTMNPPAGALGDAEARCRGLVADRQPAAGKNAARTVADHTQGPGSDFVRQNEFRLFKWLATFLVAAVAAAITLLYQQTAELRVDLERLRTDLIQEMNRQNADIREDMARLRTDLIQEMNHQNADIREAMARQFADVRKDGADIREDIASLSERVVRVETLVGGDGQPVH